MHTAAAQLAIGGVPTLCQVADAQVGVAEALDSGQGHGSSVAACSVERGGFKDLFAAFSLGCTNSSLIVHFISLAISCNRNNTGKYR